MITKEDILDILKNVLDPDLHRDIVDLGFVKNIKICDGNVKFNLELTTPACPIKDVMKDECVKLVKTLPDVKNVNVVLTSNIRSTTTYNYDTMNNVQHVIAVGSGKGGVGKSTISVNLALALLSAGAKVGILDADVYGPSQGMMLGVNIHSPNVHNNRMVPETAHGLKMISVSLLSPPDRPLILRGPMIAGIIQQFLGQVEWGALDYLIIDLPPGTGDIQLTLCQKIKLTGAVIVTTPQDVALLDARKCLRMFQELNVPIVGIIENMSSFICDGCGKEHHIFRIGGGKKAALTLGVPFLGGIPLDSALPPGGDDGTPFLVEYPHSKTAQSFKDVAGLFAQQVSILNNLSGDLLLDYKLNWDDMEPEL